MARVKNGTRRHARRKKILKAAKGFQGRRSKLFKTAKEAVQKALVYSYRDRKRRKRDFRRLWITRISAICRENGISYSHFMNGLKIANIQINRKALSNMAIEDPNAFITLIDKTKEALNAKN